MAKSIKFKNDVYFDSTGIKHNRQSLNNILDSNMQKNTNFAVLTLNGVGVTTASSYQILDYTIPEKGTYLFLGMAHTNYYGQTGRELTIHLAKNWGDFYNFVGVCNTYTWTLTMPITGICKCNKNDKIEVYISNSDSTKTWANSGGNLYVVRLNAEN